MKKKYFVILLFSISFTSISQSIQGIDTTFQWRNIGPSNQGGRIVDIEALDNQFRKVFMATGSGGVWYSGNAGTTWEPIFDNYSTSSIGDIAVNQQDPSIIWVGTGEANNRNSVSWGDGVFRSKDGGKTFQNVGLNDTHQIARVQTIPNKPEEACVCAIGHLWGYDGERGLFRTKDGGKTWEKLKKGLPKGEKSGCTDLIIDPNDHNIMYAAFYERLRQPWNFESGGLNGGIFKTIDGGKTWKKLENGLPSGATGRIGLTIYKKNPKILMAIVEAEKTDDLQKPGSGIYRSEDAGESWTYTNTYNNRPFYYSQIRINPNNDQRVYVLTTSFRVSEDGGKTFRKGSKDEEVHGDFHAMWLDPNDADRYYIGADKGMSITHDHGEKFRLFDNLPIAQFYRIGFDYRDPYYIYGGLQDNGFYATSSFSRDIRGILNDSNWKVHWGDGMYTESDPEDWRKLYTSSENGSLNKYDPVTHRISIIKPKKSTISNLKSYYSEEEIKTNRLFRYNWAAPFQMDLKSKNLYLASNHLFKSVDEGQNWKIISPDLSTNNPEKTKYRASGGLTPDNSGAETHCTISTLALSTIDENIIWAGTDDGLVRLTQNGGSNWKSLKANIEGVPEGIWVSKIEASSHKASRAYLSFDGHRSDHNQPHLFVTDDFGKTWNSITNGLPANMVIRVVREDLVNPNLLYIGTETGVWASLDRGLSWSKFMSGMPTVSVYDLAIHPRDHSLIAGSHGRSLFVMDNTHALQQLNTEIINSDFHLFEQPVSTLWENLSRGGQRGHFWYGGDNPEVIRPVSSLARARFEVDALVYYYVNQTHANKDVQLTIEDNEGQKFIKKIKAKPGFNKFLWNREFDAIPYTEDELAQLNTAFDKALQNSNSQRLKRTVEKFKNAKDSIVVQRRIITQLLNTLEVDPSLGMTKATEGEYKVSLQFEDQKQIQRLIIRNDPLLKED